MTSHKYEVSEAVLISMLEMDAMQNRQFLNMENTGIDLIPLRVDTLSVVMDIMSIPENSAARDDISDHWSDLVIDLNLDLGPTKINWREFLEYARTWTESSERETDV